MGSLRLEHQRALVWGSYTAAIGPDYEEVDIPIGQMAASVDGDPVDPKEYGINRESAREREKERERERERE